MNPKPNIPYKLVYVEWEDSMGSQSHWTSLRDIKEESAVCRSVGWLVHDGDKVKVIVPHLSFDGGQPDGCGDMSIPASAIRKMKTIKL